MELAHELPSVLMSSHKLFFEEKELGKLHTANYHSYRKIAVIDGKIGYVGRLNLAWRTFVVAPLSSVVSHVERCNQVPQQVGQAAERAFACKRAFRKTGKVIRCSLIK